MDKYQATVTVKQAAVVFLGACVGLYAHTVAKMLTAPDVAGYLWIVGVGGLLATFGVLLSNVLKHGLPTYHLDDDVSLFS